MRKILSLILGVLWALPVWGALPSGYTELEYIESTGTQWIDTGIQKGRFVHDIAFTVRDNKNLMGNSAGAGSYWGQNRGNAEDGFEFGSSKIFTSSLIRQTVVFNTIPTKTTLTANGETVASASSVANSTYYVFAINGATDLYSASAKLWSLKIYDGNDELIKNLVPAKNPDGKIGMYDTVSGEFFENKGEGTFVAGPVVEIKIATTKYNETKFSPLNTALANAISVVDTVVSNTITQAGRIATLQAQKQTRPNDIADDNEKCPAGKKCLLVEDASGVPHWYEIVEPLLPVGYTQLQWIESTGTQFIDTGIKANASIVVDMGVLFSRIGSTYAALGTRNGTNTSDTNVFQFGVNSNNIFFHRYGVGAPDGTGVPVAQTLYDVHLENYKEIISNGQDTYTNTLEFNPNMDTEGTLYIFATHDISSGRPIFSMAGYITYLSISVNGVLVRDFIPAKNPDGKVGMYDLANGVFYENKGTGEFIAGAPVSE